MSSMNLLYTRYGLYTEAFFLSVYFCRKKSKVLYSKIQELEISLNSCMQKSAAERQGRIRAQQVSFLIYALSPFSYYIVLLL